jgi:uncharacterized protein YcfJ
MEEAAKAERIRTAPEREAAARAAALTEESEATAKRRLALLKNIAGMVLGAIGGAIVGIIIGIVVGLVIGTLVFVVGGLWMWDSTKGGTLANNVFQVVVILGATIGAVVWGFMGRSVFNRKK